MFVVVVIVVVVVVGGGGGGGGVGSVCGKLRLFYFLLFLIPSIFRLYIIVFLYFRGCILQKCH